MEEQWKPETSISTKYETAALEPVGAAISYRDEIEVSSF